jgi:hypothetical protein
MTTLADIEIKILLLSDSLPRCGRFAARKALARIAQHAGQPLPDIAASDAEALYEKLQGTVTPKTWIEERRYLAHALRLPDLPQGLADRVRRGEATLADACAAVDLQIGWSGERTRITGAVRRFADLAQRRTGRVDIPAVERVVDSLLEGMTHTDLGLSASSVPAFRSRVRRAVRLVDIHAHQQVSASLLGTEWQSLVDLVRKHPSQNGTLAKLWPLVAFCHRRDLPPEAVDDSTVADLLADLEGRECRDSLSMARGVVYAWERLQASVPGWPGQKLQRLYRHGSRVHAVEFRRLPEAVREAWDRFVAAHAATSSPSRSSLANLVPEEEAVFSLSAEAVPVTDARFGPQQLSTMRTWVTYAANVLVARGEEVRDLADLVRPDVVRAVLENAGRRQQERAKAQDRQFHRVNATLLNGATTFVTLARIVGVGDPAVEELIELRDRVDPRLREKRRGHDGTVKRIYHDIQIGPRHAERLAQFRDPAKLAAWFETPDRLWERMRAVTRRGVPPAPEEINDAIVCVIYQVTVGGCPVRRANLASLRISGPGRNLLLPGRKGQPGQIRIEWWETKNRKELTVELTPQAAEVVQHFVEHFRPRLMANVGSAPDNPYLFPAGGQGHRDGALLNAAFVDRNRKLGGFLLNVHVQRHLTAFVILKHDPHAMDIVQRVLGHRNRKTTARYYAQIDDIVAQQRYHELLELARLHAQRLPLLRGRW